MSEPLRLKPDDSVMRWLAAQPPETLFITTLSVAEMLTGVEKMAKGRKRVALQIAINEQVLPLFEGRVLGFDAASAVAFSKVTVGANAVGNDIDFADASIAAITLAAGYVLATRNVRDFIGTKLLRAAMRYAQSNKAVGSRNSTFSLSPPATTMPWVPHAANCCSTSLTKCSGVDAPAVTAIW